MIGKSYAKIAIVGFVLCLAMVLCASFARYRSEQSFIDGAENGFGIDGMYVDLLDNDGADCGSVHLSYASRDGMDGILYVSHETGDFKMRRTNRVPAFIEE